jgi:L,D-transpeptidase ErfK/SrfK
MRLGIPGGAYLIHGTNLPAGVGMQVTHGCIRMYPEDIAAFFAMVPVKTQVNLVDQTTKVGWSRGTLYLERHAPLEGTDDPSHLDPAELERQVAAATTGLETRVDWVTARTTFSQNSGVPVRIGLREFPAVPQVATVPSAADASQPSASADR